MRVWPFHKVNKVTLLLFVLSVIVVCLFNSKGGNFSKFRKLKVLNCNVARSISRLGIFRCFFIVGHFWLPFNLKCVTF